MRTFRLGTMVLLALAAASAFNCTRAPGDGANSRDGSGGDATGGTRTISGETGGSGAGRTGGSGGGGNGGGLEICPAGRGGGGQGTDAGAGAVGAGGVGGVGGAPSLAPGVTCDDTDGGRGNEGGGDGPEVREVCPYANDPLFQAGTSGAMLWVARTILPCPMQILTQDATFLWTSSSSGCHTSGGTFSGPTSNFTGFVCNASGDVTLTLHVGFPNTSCDTQTSWVLHCQL